MKQLDKESMKLQYLKFTDSLKSLMLSTVDEQGKPFISYAPFVKKEGKLYIYLSRIANHYRYMESNPSVDVMLIEDETSTENLFARQRARFVCQATNIGNEGHEDIFELFGEAFGKPTINMLKTLDFSLFELTTLQGRYVAGFGQAYDIDLTAEQFDHVARDGHQQPKSS
ncbi:pyridoxamine 5'-phosphate oxidase family protein [Paenibacillus sp. CGMCC 1.16610]|uniref:Heme iron utilization protein n=1 Tax=Paenibacillus anseongense TaxID=2682845 RepID=A0ABW9U3X7_9BACL|nr:MULTISPECIES: pyridoxamine 5'-phosphate oxidase family protein [Paenibacillus]MBA2941661.1 pyridoxamine 5'-phosphate oxidase family protein [Paenibacillus sp. CGMCC 1.16610]MVQ34181.1 heme iron utilization protein [Paenibacillus anseongense]